MDPRVKVARDDLNEQLALESRLASRLTQSYEAIVTARSIGRQLRRLPESAAVTQAAKALEQKVTLLLDGPKDSSREASTPALTKANRDLLSLYKEIEKADARPTVVDEAAATAAEAELDRLLGRWRSLKTEDIPALNRQLSAAGLESLDTQSAAPESDGEPDQN
jgi:hypothetical protein